MEPVELQHLAAALCSAAVVVVAGLLYALLYAWSRIRGQRWIMVFAYLAFALLAMSVTVLAAVLHLQGPWRFMVATMLIGYLLAPHGIWHLCVGTHAEEPEDPLRRRAVPPQ